MVLGGVLGAALVVAPAACTPAPSAWDRVELPGGGAVVTLTAVPEGVVVGRYDEQSAHPATLTLLPVAGQGAPSQVPLSSESGYAPMAPWQSVVAAGRRLIALGGARGGAHGNVRWTIWRGSVSGVVEEPQPFETFGGQEAGTLVGLAAPDGPGPPLVVGTWASPSGRGTDLTSWRPEGRRWLRDRAAPAELAGTATSLPTPEQVTSSGSVVVVAGWATELGEHIENVPVAWVRQADTDAWRRIPLRSPTGWTPTRSTPPPAEPGQVEPTQVDPTQVDASQARQTRTGRARAVGCRPGLCLLLGAAAEGLVGWWLPVPSGGDAVSDRDAEPLTLPAPVPPDGAAWPAPVVAGATAYALVPGDGGSQVLAVSRTGSGTGSGTDVEAVADLPGAPVALAAAPDGRLLAATAAGPVTTLWRESGPVAADRFARR